jgi:RNA polymerase sigma-70 factor, ECF subfamily
VPGKYFEQEQEAQANLPACELVLTGAPERKKAMRHAQPQRDRILQRNQVPDGVLVGQALAGDQAAFDSLVNRYHHHLMGFIRGMLKDRDQCYDVLQHVYLQLYLSLPTLSKSVSLKPWLVQVARNRCLDELRRRRRRPEVLFSTLEREQRGEGLSPLEAIPDSEPLPEEITENTELQSLLRAAMVSLPPQFRSIMHLRCFRQLTFSEIGHTLNMPETTVKTYFYRSLLRVRRALESTVQWASIS